jgi:ATP synthase protein I
MAQAPTEEDKNLPGGDAGGPDEADFERRLKKARREAGLEPTQEPPPPASLAGYALRLASELVAGVVVGGFIGWWIDRTFRTSPFGLIGFLVLGTAAGTFNLVRSVKQMNAKLGTGSAPAAPVEDDDEDD